MNNVQIYLVTCYSIIFVTFFSSSDSDDSDSDSSSDSETDSDSDDTFFFCFELETLEFTTLELVTFFAFVLATEFSEILGIDVTSFTSFKALGSKSMIFFVSGSLATDSESDSSLSDSLLVALSESEETSDSDAEFWPLTSLLPASDAELTDSAKKIKLGK